MFRTITRIRSTYSKRKKVLVIVLDNMYAIGLICQIDHEVNR